MKHFLFLLFALPLVLVSCNPDEDDNELSGCMDPDADNFNPEATVSDGSCVYGLAGCGGSSSVTFDGYTYELVAIGDQCWFAENLRTEHYANGDAIPGELSDGEWSSTTNGAQAIFANDASNLTDYGRLYNWFAVDDARGLCPSGWHVPTDVEYTTLTDGLGGTSVAGGKMKSSPEDSPAWNGTNTSGFSGLAGGYRTTMGASTMEATAVISGRLRQTVRTLGLRVLDGGNTEVHRYNNYQRGGFSVRCVRD